MPCCWSLAMQRLPSGWPAPLRCSVSCSRYPLYPPSAAIDPAGHLQGHLCFYVSDALRAVRRVWLKRWLSATSMLQAIAAYSRVLSLEPHNSRARLRRASCRNQQGDFDGANGMVRPLLYSINP